MMCCAPPVRTRTGRSCANGEPGHGYRMDLRSLNADRIAVFGDLSGHLAPLISELAALGVRFDRSGVPRAITHWPDDLAVVQVGDLVHKGPDSEVIVAVVHDLLIPSGRWIQLVGNHESQYLPPGRHFWSPKIDPTLAGALVNLWDRGDMVAAAAIETHDGRDMLATHAGLTVQSHDLLTRELGQAPSAAQVVAALRDPRRQRLVFAAGTMLGMRDDPGVIWAEARSELHVPWVQRAFYNQAPSFDQVHGHSAPIIRVYRRGFKVPDDLAEFTARQPSSGHWRTLLPSPHKDDDGSLSDGAAADALAADGIAATITAIDPGANERRVVAPKPLMLKGTVRW